jgi:hypothetical protein
MWNIRDDIIKEGIQIMSKMQIVINLESLKISKCGQYYNMPEVIDSDNIKLIGINSDAEAYIYRSRLVIKKGGAKPAAAAKSDNTTARIDNIEKALGSIIELLASQNVKKKTKA